MILICDFLKEETYKHEQNIEDSLEVYTVRPLKQNKKKTETEVPNLLHQKSKLLEIYNLLKEFLQKIDKRAN